MLEVGELVGSNLAGGQAGDLAGKRRVGWVLITCWLDELCSRIAGGGGLVMLVDELAVAWKATGIWFKIAATNQRIPCYIQQLILICQSLQFWVLPMPHSLKGQDTDTVACSGASTQC